MKNFIKTIVIIIAAAGILSALSSCSSKTYTLTYLATEGGSITGEAIQAVENGKDGKEVTATSDDGYVFTHWSDGETNPVRHDKQIEKNLTITAAFAKVEGSIELTVTYSAGYGGSIQGTTLQNIPYGQNATTVTAAADDGYEFVKWSDGKTTAQRTDENIKSGLTVTAIFAKVQEPVYIEVRYIAGEGGVVEEGEIHSVLYGQSLTVTAKADDGYEFVKWSDGKTTAQRTDENIKSGLTVTAIFTKVQESVYIEVRYIAGEGGVIQGVATQNVPYGQSTTVVTAKADDGYEFVKWSDGKTTALRTDENITGPIEITAYFKRIKLQISYTANEGGRIDGKTEQTVYYGYAAETVTAIPNEGYSFVEWSEGKNNAQRADENITSGFTISATFKSLTKTFTYIYNNATDNNTTPNIIIHYSNLYDTEFIVPVKEHFIFNGWYLESDFSTQISDESGNFLLNHEVFDTDSTNVYAKWTVIEELTYKVLMIFVTETKATLTTIEGVDIDVHYVMSDIEKQICALLPGQIEKTLNEMFDGLVTFQVDSYFTKEVAGYESFSVGSRSDGKLDYAIFGNKTPEIQHLLPNYRSVITTFGMNDYGDILHSSGGGGQRKYASCYIETLFGSFYRTNPRPLDELLDLASPYWSVFVDHYLHEFTHTVELYYPYGQIFKYHATESYYIRNNDMRGIEVTKLYLLGQADVGIGELAGIPYSFWQYKAKTFTYVYNGATGGNTEESIELTPECLVGTETTFAIPTKEGYTFEGWFLEPEFITLIGRKDGYLGIGLPVFDIDSDYIYAKWLPL